tara:strand:+ start:262 stop:510 length:249 start_codon:yes stop_codon:yes gene_type:complete
MPRKNHNIWTEGATASIHINERGRIKRKSEFERAPLRLFSKISTPGTNNTYTSQEIQEMIPGHDDNSIPDSSSNGRENAQQI